MPAAAGAGGAPPALNVLGAGILREPELMCLYSAAILGPPWLSIMF